MRNMDRAMSNIESMPGGFNAMSRLHQQMDQLQRDTADTPASTTPGGGGASDNPFASLFQPAIGGNAAGAAATTTTTTTGTRDGHTGAPSNAPLPNPWAQPQQPAAAATTGGGANTNALGGLDLFGGLGGANMNDPTAMMQNPVFQSIMNSMIQDPAAMEAMTRQMQTAMESDPRFANMPPHVRQMMSNPEAMRSMMQMMSDPQSMAALSQMSEAMRQMEGTPLGRNLGLDGAGGLPAGLGGLGLGGAAPTGTGGAPGAGGMPDFNALLGMLGGGGGGGLGGAGLGGFGVPPPPSNPEETFADQLTQLQEMGFFDREANVRALVATGGNVHAAVDRLLQMM